MYSDSFSFLFFLSSCGWVKIKVIFYTSIRYTRYVCVYTYVLVLRMYWGQCLATSCGKTGVPEPNFGASSFFCDKGEAFATSKGGEGGGCRMMVVAKLTVVVSDNAMCVVS